MTNETRQALERLLEAAKRAAEQAQQDLGTDE